jgi:hypothetical protein
MTTTTLRNGQLVLARSTKDGNVVPKTFANLKQAKAAAEASGGYVRVGFPFLVVIPATEAGR